MSTRLHRGAAALAALATLATGCGTVGSMATSSPEHRAEETDAGEAIVRSAPPSPWVAELLDDGEAPRRALRVRPEEGSLQRATLQREVDTEFGFAGIDPVASSAVVRSEVAYSVDAVTDRGFVLHVSCRPPEVDGATMAGPGRDAVDDGQIDAVFGVWSDDRTGCGDRLTISSRYEVLAREPADGEASPEDAAAGAGALGYLDTLDPALRTLVLPLPTERVGEGARWAATSTTDVEGVPVVIEGEAELIALDDDAAIVDVSVRTAVTDAHRTTILGRAVDLRTGLGRTTARLVYAFDAPVPLGEIRFTERLEARVDDRRLDAATGPVLARHSQSETITVADE
ncbi:MAG: hypothetical protein S0880_14735 [Actinomycetota bacterium]|nr:hypothetical protein [Actinomycetota bacterium]